MRIQPGRELVEYRHSRVADQGERYREPLLHAAGKILESSATALREPQIRQQAVWIDRIGIEGREEIHGFLDGDAIRLPAFLELNTDQPAKLVAVDHRVEAQDSDPPSVGAAQTRDAFHGGGLPGPVGTQDAEDLALVHGH